MKKLFFIILSVLCVVHSACGHSTEEKNEGGNAMYLEISQQEAKELMDSQKDFVILDVREQEEFDQGHIGGAILIPYTQIGDKAEEILPRKDQLILVYCRSGRRSKIAAQVLSDLGYTNVKEFGGIIDWPYGVEQ